MWLASWELPLATKDALIETGRRRFRKGFEQMDKLIDSVEQKTRGQNYCVRPISWFKIIEAAGLMNEAIKSELMSFILAGE